MLNDIILLLLFVAVFIFLGWRIVTRQRSEQPDAETYVCPRCNEHHCDCVKRSDLENEPKP